MASRPTTKPHPQRGFLIPVSILQILVMLTILTSDLYLEISTGFSPGAVIIIMICACSIVVSIVEIFLFAVHKLQPSAYLIVQIIMTMIWLTLFLLSLLTNWQVVTGDTTGKLSERLIPSLLQPVMALTLYVATLIYASVIYHRYRRYNAKLGRRTQSQAGLELFMDEKSGSRSEWDGSTVAGPYEISPVERTPIRGVQELGDETFIKQLGGGLVNVVDCDGKVHELAASQGRATSVKD